MSEQIKDVCGKNDTPRSDLKRKRQPATSDFRANEHGDGKTSFNDMCDHEIDMILCNLPLEDLVNTSDVSHRLRCISGSIFARRYAHVLISLVALHHPSCSVCNTFRGRVEPKHPAYGKDVSTVSITDYKIWFKLFRNFGQFIKHIRIRDEGSTEIVAALQNLSKYVSVYCSNSLETLHVDSYRFFSLDKPLTALQEFGISGECLDNSEALELMPNVRRLKFSIFPNTVAKYYPNVERVDFDMYSDKHVRTFLAFIRLNRQIKHLTLSIFECSPELGESIYSSVAANLTQLKTFKVHDSNYQTIPAYRFQTVESFSSSHGTPRYTFEFNDLKKLTLRAYHGGYFMDFVLRNKKLKILKIDFLYVHEAFWNGAVIRAMLDELSELEQIIVRSPNEGNNLIFKNALGKQWEQFEKKKTVKFDQVKKVTLQRFRKNQSTTIPLSQK